MITTDLEETGGLGVVADRPAPRSLSVLPMLAAHAAADPRGLAVMSGNDRVSAGEAVRRVARLVELLAVTGVEVGDPVAVIAERSASAVLARLAALAAGAVCVPLDPQLPVGRLRAIVADIKPRAAIAMDRAWSEELGVPWIAANPGGVPSWRRAPTIPAESPAYIAYTSGSTGAAKGVVIPHRALTNLHTDLSARVIAPAAAAAGRRLTVAHALAMGFDASWHPILWLLRGHSLRVLSEHECSDPAAFATAIVRERLDVVEALPSQIEQLLDVGLLDRGVRWRPSVLLMGGEPVSCRLWRRLRRERGIRAINFYGPTEATIAASWCDLSSRRSPSIGRAVAGTELHLLAADGIPARIGEVGELVITGVAVAAGYHDRPAETAERFVFSLEESEPVGYRTGDLCRRASDGELEFVGRCDEQVKIRGYRVEIGEIEATLGEHSQVRQARVVLDGDRLLCAVVPVAPWATGAEQLREFLAARLPEFMLPHHIALRDALPTGPTGKVDTAALVAECAAEIRPTGPPPRNHDERVVAAVWERVLNMPPGSAGRGEDFVALGGHSLLLTLVTRELSRRGLPCAVGELADNPTIAELASRLARHDPQAS